VLYEANSQFVGVESDIGKGCWRERGEDVRGRGRKAARTEALQEGAESY
jgi:hypothetical protein